MYGIRDCVCVCVCVCVYVCVVLIVSLLQFFLFNDALVYGNIVIDKKKVCGMCIV